MRKTQPLIIALIISFTLVVCIGVLILNWNPQEAGKQSDQIPSARSTLLASQPGTQHLNEVPNQPVNQSTSHSSNQETEKENGKDSNISSDSAQERPLAEAQVIQPNNEQTSSRPDGYTQPVVPQIPNTNLGSGETTPEQNQNEPSKQENLFDRIESSIKETLSKASLVPSKS